MIRVDGRLAFSGGFYKIGNCESKLCPKNCVSYTYLIPKSLPKIPILLNKDSPTWALPDSRIKDLFKVEWRYFLAQHFDLMLGAKIWGIFAFLQQRRVRLCAFDVYERGEGRGAKWGVISEPRICGLWWEGGRGKSAESTGCFAMENWLAASATRRKIEHNTFQIFCKYSVHNKAYFSFEGCGNPSLGTGADFTQPFKCKFATHTTINS